MIYSDIIKGIEKLPIKLLVTILELVIDRLEIYSVSEMAKLEGKSRNGILISNRYKKIMMGKTTLAIKGIENKSEFPF